MKMPSSGIWRRMVFVRKYVSEKYMATIITVENSGLGT
jgi:hypothetical protein